MERERKRALERGDGRETRELLEKRHFITALRGSQSPSRLGRRPLRERLSTFQLARRIMNWRTGRVARRGAGQFCPSRSSVASLGRQTPDNRTHSEHFAYDEVNDPFARLKPDLTLQPLTDRMPSG